MIPAGPHHDVARDMWLTTAFVALLAWAIALGLASVLSGCANMTRGQIVDKAITVGGDVLTCGADEAGPVEDAITHGGADWVSIVMAAWHCVDQVVRDLRQKDAVAAACESYDARDHRTIPPAACHSYLASAGPDGVIVEPKYVRLSRRAKQRLAAAEVLGQLMRRNVRP